MNKEDVKVGVQVRAKKFPSFFYLWATITHVEDGRVTCAFDNGVEIEDSIENFIGWYELVPRLTPKDEQ